MGGVLMNRPNRKTSAIVVGTTTLLAVLAVGWSVPARASVVIYSSTQTAAGGDYKFDLPGFDPAMGSLTSVKTSYLFSVNAAGPATNSMDEGSIVWLYIKYWSLHGPDFGDGLNEWGSYLGYPVAPDSTRYVSFNESYILTTHESNVPGIIQHFYEVPEVAYDYFIGAPQFYGAGITGPLTTCLVTATVSVEYDFGPSATAIAPEPSSVVMIGTGLPLGLFFWRWRRHRAARTRVVQG
jgi:hypothetical protein